MINNSKFDKRLEKITPEIVSKIAEIDTLKGRWISGAKLNPQLLGRLKKSVLVTSAGASTRIEGARLSDEDVEKLVQGLKIQSFTDRDKQEVRGYYELLEKVFDAWKNVKFSESTIKHFHKEILRYAEKDQRHRGDYKKSENRVEMFDASGKLIGVVFEPTPAYLTPKETQELIEWTARALSGKKYHPLLIAGNFVVEFLKIHPFQDGNGRLSRILTNLLLLQAGYVYMPYVSHEKIVEDNKSDYYIALRKSQKSEDITHWLIFFLSVVLKQSQMAIDLLSNESIEKILSPKQLAVWQYLQNVEEATPAQIAKNANIARATVNQVVDTLLRLQRVERIGQGRGTRYRRLKG